jgi:hypothetical protein
MQYQLTQGRNCVNRNNYIRTQSCLDILGSLRNNSAKSTSLHYHDETIFVNHRHVRNIYLCHTSSLLRDIFVIGTKQQKIHVSKHYADCDPTPYWDSLSLESLCSAMQRMDWHWYLRMIPLVFWFNHSWECIFWIFLKKILCPWIVNNVYIDGVIAPIHMLFYVHTTLSFFDSFMIIFISFKNNTIIQRSVPRGRQALPKRWAALTTKPVITYPNWDS